jgi:excisionase family DNA binding protein
MKPAESFVDELLTVEEVAERLHTSVRFVRRLISERRIRFVKLGKFVRISSADVEDFVSAGRVEPRVALLSSRAAASTSWAR